MEYSMGGSGSRHPESFKVHIPSRHPQDIINILAPIMKEPAEHSADQLKS
jgi:hypothetical protein